MIKPVGQAMSAAVEAAKLRETTQTRAPARVSSPATSREPEVVTSTIAQIAAQGAPVDLDKIARIKSAIAAGNYPVDADAIAERMVELDLPRSLN